MKKWSTDLTDDLPEESFSSYRHHNGRLDYCAYRAFNNHPEDSNFFDDCEGYQVKNPSQDEFLKIDFLNSVCPSLISIQGLPDDYLPKKIEILASNNDIDYCHIDYINNIIGDSKIHYYEFKKRGNFRFFKVKFIEYNKSWIIINQIEFFKDLTEIKYLLKQNNKFYTIKSEFYQSNSFKKLDIIKTSKEIYEKYGFTYLNDLFKEINNISEKRTIDGKKILEFNIDKNINRCHVYLENNFEILNSLPISSFKSDVGTFSGSEADKIVGNATNGWNPTTSDNATITIDLLKQYYLENIELTPFIGRCKSIEIYTSEDGSIFTQVKNYIISKEEKLNSIKINTMCRFLRIKVIDTYEHNVWIKKLNVYVNTKDIRCLLKNNNQYYTIKDKNIIKLEDFINTLDYIDNNGFKDESIISNELLKKYFDNLSDIKLLVYCKDTSKKDLNIIYELISSFRPIDKFKGKLELLKQVNKQSD